MNWTELLRVEPALASPDHHAEALTRLAARLLRDGQASIAARLMQRRVGLRAPAVGERALLALAADRAAQHDVSAAALAAALAADPLDPTVGRVALRLAPSPEARRAAAALVIGSPLASDEALSTALAALFAAGIEAAATLDLCDGRLAGWVAWRGGQAPVLFVGADIRHQLAADARPGFAPPGASMAFLDLVVPMPTDRYEVRRDDATLAAGRLTARSRFAPPGAIQRAPSRTPERRALRIVMPVFGDPDATAEALTAAIGETRRHPGTELVVVDDASPDAAIRQLLDMLASRGWIELRGNPVNLGFTGAVARGLDGLGDRDALILNSDAILPEGAIERFREAVYAAPDVGSATPFSNNGEWTSLPQLGRAAPLVSPAAAAELDRAARDAGGAPVDLPNGVGFALWLRHDALAAVGGFSALYERGYFEDAELTLRIREAGWRNVAVTSLVVPHHGSRSFGVDKARLVARNLRRLRRRVPSLREASAAFRLADPLRAARAAIEERQPPAGHPVLLVAPAGSALATERLRRHRAVNRPVVTLAWRLVGASLRVELRGGDLLLPQSLDMTLPKDTARLGDWLRRLDPERVELAGASAPEPLAAAVLASGSALAILAGDLHGGAPTLLAGFASWDRQLGERWLEVVACERATLAALSERLRVHSDAARIVSDLADETCPVPPAAKAGDARRLAIVMGVPSPRSVGFARRLAAAMRAVPGQPRCAAFGTSFDDGALIRGGIDLGGTPGVDVVGGIAGEAGLSALVLPPADPSIALFERVAHSSALPFARLDWADGAEPAAHPALLLPRSHGESDTIRALVDWFAGRLAA